MIRACDPQRQRWGSSAARISSSEGSALRSQEPDRADDHPGDAVAALSGLLVEERPLDRVQPVGVADALERRDARPDEGVDAGGAARPHLAVDEHGAGVALLEAAAELGAGQAEVVAQDLAAATYPGSTATRCGAPFTSSSISPPDFLLGGHLVIVSARAVWADRTRKNARGIPRRKGPNPDDVDQDHL